MLAAGFALFTLEPPRDGMETVDLLATSQQFTRQQVRLCLNGNFTHSLLEEFGRSVRQYLRECQLDEARSTDVFSVYVELAQNVQSYARRAFGGLLGAARDRAAHGLVMLQHDGAHFSICSGNRVRAEHADALTARLDRLLGLDKAALKALYKQQLKAPASSDGSAGLGLLAMARTAARPLEYKLEPLPDGLRYFSLCVTL